MSKTYYTVSKQNKHTLELDTIGGKFDTYDEAYDFMCLVYLNEKNKHTPHTRYGIWRTTETEHNGDFNVMRQPTWS